MRYKSVYVAGIIVLTSLSGCIPPLFSKDEPLAGTVYLNAPLDSAKIVVETPSGTALATSTSGMTFQGRFFETLSLPAPAVGEYAQWFDSYFPLTIKINGGTLNGKAFDGTLLGYTYGFSPEKDLHVNILTTLIVKYKLATGVTLKQAEIIVKTALGIPAEMDIVKKMNDPNYWNYFNPTRYMALTEAHGGFDAFTDLTVANLKSSRNPGFDFIGEGEGDEIPGIASKFGKWIGESSAEGLVAWGVGEVMGWVLNGFSTQDPTEQTLNEIKSELNTMNQELTTIQTGITNLTNLVTQLMQTVNLEWANLIATYDSLNMSNEETVIQNQYNKLMTDFTATNPDVCTPAGSASAMLFARDILGASAYDIDQQIYNMYAQMTGLVAGSNGALVDMTTQLIVQAQSGQDLLQCYYVLENYFGQLVAIQAQGLDLMIEAIHEVQDTNLPYSETATDYYNKYQTQINAETELFLACVDRLVVSGVNVRSELAAKFNYLPTEVTTIYNRADFVASQLSTQQPAGLVIRLIGDPVHVTDWITNNRITANGTPLTVVSVNGNTTNNYTAPIPASTPNVAYYLEWTANGSTYTFQTETNISVVKLQLPVTAVPTVPASYTVTSPTGSQTIPVGWYDINFQQISAPDPNDPNNPTGNADSLYGSGVFFVRVLPTWQSDPGKKTEDKKNQWGTTYTPNPANVSVCIQSTPVQLRMLQSAPITYTGGIHTTLCNGTTANVTLAFNWNAVQNITDNWGNDAFGNQSLICQSTSQQAANNTPTTTSGFTFDPNTNTTVDYQVQQSLTSMYSNYMQYGYLLTTNAWLNSVEVIPTSK